MKSIIVSGNIVQIQSKYSIPVDRLSVAIEPVQSGSSDPSPDNVRPISGWDGVNVTRCGKNLGQISDSTMGSHQRGDVQYSDSGVTVTSTGNYCRSGYLFSVKAGQRYRLSYKARGVGLKRIYYGELDGAWGTGYPGFWRYLTIGEEEASYQYDFTATDSGLFFFGMYVSTTNYEGNYIQVSDFQLELGSTATEYEPYLGETYSIAFPAGAGTVYGGTLDVTTGLLTVDKKYHAVTSDDVTGLFQTGTNANRVGIRLPDSRPSPSGLRLDILCNKARPSIDILTQSAFRVGDCCIYSDGSDTYSTALFGVPITATTGPDAKAYLISEGYAFVYSLATPVTYQLDPVAVSMIQGTNNIWADAGEIEVEYRPYARAVFDGISTIDYDVYVYPTDTMYQAPAHQYTMLTVPGRSGSLLIDEKRFDNIDREYGVVIAESGKVNIDLLRNALASRGGYFRLEDTFDTTHFFMATYNKIFTPAIDWRGNSAKITLSFNCKPQRYLKSGETVIDMSSNGNITNPTRFSAKPLLRVYGNGVLGVGSTNITIAGNTYSYVDIDCDMGRAYYGATPLDSKITLNTIDYPELAPGNNGIVLGTGITRVIITPRWWEL